MSAPYLGDFAEDEALHFMWSSNDGDGASITRATDGTVSVYKDNGATQSTAGVTDTEDFDSLTGIHACTIDLSADAFYAVNANYMVVLSAATIDGQTVNAVLAHFSIENRTAFPKADYPSNFASLGIEADGDLTKVNTLDGHTAQTANHTSNIADILTDTAEIGAAGAGLTEAGGTGDHLTAQPWNAAWDAEVTARATVSIEDAHLDHLLAATYDPASKPGAADALLNELIESDAGVSRYTENALEQAPTGGSAPTVGEIADAVCDELLAGHTDAGSLAKALSDILTDTDTTIPGLIGALNDLTAAQVNAEVDTALSDYDGPTKAELDSGLAALNDFDPAADTVARVTLTDTTTDVTNEVTADAAKISGSATAADNLEASALGIVSSSAKAGTLSTTQATTNLTEATDDHYIGRIVVWTSGACANQATDITDYTGATKLLTYTAMTDAPSADDTFVIV